MPIGIRKTASGDRVRAPSQSAPPETASSSGSESSVAGQRKFASANGPRCFSGLSIGQNWQASIRTTMKPPVTASSGMVAPRNRPATCSDGRSGVP
jgi:hypothetical protein